MDTRMINIFKENEAYLLEQFTKEQPSSYRNILVQTLKAMFEDSEGDKAEYGEPDYQNIHTIDDGDYQGTLLFIIPECCYQPSKYWAVNVGYGSCSGCDTYQAYAAWDERGYADSAPHMLTMALHMIQSMKEI